MLWIILALSAYFLLAIVELIDKRILSSPVVSALPYAFYAGLLVSFSFILWPLDFSFLSPLVTIYALVGGIAFFVAIYFLYSAIIKGEVSRVISIVGGLSPILIFIFSLLFLNEKFSFYFLAALLALVTGSILLSLVKDGERFKFRQHFFLSCFLAAFFFALSYGLTKAVFTRTSFLNGFIWIRVGTLFCVIFVFLVPKFRRCILESSRGFSTKLTTLFFVDKGISALAHILLNYAIKIGSVAIINALQAVEYAFIFVLASGLSYFFPRVFCESLAPKHLIPKIIGIALISFGVVLLFIGGA
jgi:uncharacterized membrane protein